MPFDAGLIGAIHVQRLSRREAYRDAAAPDVVFQTSTIEALLDGAYEGDLTFAELAAHGTLGLGTVQHLDGEMIALDGCFWRADLEGRLHLLDPGERTPFAVVVPFSPRAEAEIAGPTDLAGLYRLLDELDPLAAAPCLAFRIDGRFPRLLLRSVPRQAPPYRPLAEVVAGQSEFELEDVTGTIVGFRFPTEAQGLEVAGYHLHAATADRTRGGHVLDALVGPVAVALDPSSDLHLELPPGIELATDEGADTRALLERLEGATGDPPAGADRDG